MQNCYRNRYDIFESILNTANGNEVKQLEILSEANLSHGLFKKIYVPIIRVRFNRIYTT